MGFCFFNISSLWIFDITVSLPRTQEIREYCIEIHMSDRLHDNMEPLSLSLQMLCCWPKLALRWSFPDGCSGHSAKIPETASKGDHPSPRSGCHLPSHIYHTFLFCSRTSLSFFFLIPKWLHTSLTHCTSIGTQLWLSLCKRRICMVWFKNTTLFLQKQSDLKLPHCQARQSDPAIWALKRQRPGDCNFNESRLDYMKTFRPLSNHFTIWFCHLSW